MQIVIPMSGTGQRFIEAGYKTHKALIEIDGKPVIEHVCDLFPGEENFTFICSQHHLETTNMREILMKLKPNGKIIPIEPHKLGPVYAVSQIFDLLKDEEEVIVNYCDFGMYWDYQDFLKQTRVRDADGAVPAYRGFHPHMLGLTNYAFIREKNGFMLEIKEKEPFTDNRMEEYASSGTYYCKKGSYIKKYFRELMDKSINLKGEFYVSLIYNLLVKDGLKVSVYEIEHMLQWGTPADMDEYNMWSNCFRKLAATSRPDSAPRANSINLIPMAGFGSRFAKENYKDPKPLIEVTGKPMVIQAVNSLPKAEKNLFVCLEEHLKSYPLEKAIKENFPGAEIVSIKEVTEGQACSCELGLKGQGSDQSLLISACDNGIIYDHKKYEELLADESVDAIAFSFRNNPTVAKNPKAYGYYVTDKEGGVSDVSVKIPISDNPLNDHAVVGAFFFRKAKYFIEGLQKMYQDDIRVNGEFYVDSLMGVLAKMGRKVVVFEVDNYICWGTPNDLKTFEYWQSFFNKTEWHPYRIEEDFMNS